MIVIALPYSGFSEALRQLNRNEPGIVMGLNDEETKDLHRIWNPTKSEQKDDGILDDDHKGGRKEQNHWFQCGECGAIPS
ncbi:hypothetical protein NC652_034188 [Populus alba x Populus x berolinensis]|nr:hypothetical protein NC652_034188 [Populus alba x Populus x berolinensis]